MRFGQDVNISLNASNMQLSTESLEALVFEQWTYLQTQFYFQFQSQTLDGSLLFISKSHYQL